MSIEKFGPSSVEAKVVGMVALPLLSVGLVSHMYNFSSNRVGQTLAKAKVGGMGVPLSLV